MGADKSKLMTPARRPQNLYYDSNKRGARPVSSADSELPRSRKLASSRSIQNLDKVADGDVYMKLQSENTTVNYETPSVYAALKDDGIFSNNPQSTINSKAALGNNQEKNENVYSNLSLKEGVYANVPRSANNSDVAALQNLEIENIKIREGSITKNKVDVLVCPVCGDSGDITNSGVILSEVLRLGGYELRKACGTLSPVQLECKLVLEKEVLSVKSCGLLTGVCSYIFFIYIKNYSSNDSKRCLEYMTTSIEYCLTKAKKFNLSTISFSTIGCGNMNYPDIEVAQCFKKAVSSSGAGLKVIICAMTNMFQKFQDHFECETTQEAPDRSATRWSTMITSNLCVPDYWQIRGRFIDELISTNSHNRSLLLPYSDVYKEVESLMLDTWKSEYVGWGQDAKGLSHKEIKIINIFCVENPSQLKKYNRAKETMNYKYSTSGPVASLQDQPMTSTASAPQLSKNLDPDVNEFYFFHGTRASNRLGITSEGFDIRLSNSNGLFGSGVYFAESSTKADQYTGRAQDIDKRLSVAGRNRYYIFICRVTLGNPYMCSSPKKFKSPPCKKNCHTDNCTDKDHFPHFDSVIGTHNSSNKKLLFREFILYDQHRCYPEFLVLYERNN